MAGLRSGRLRGVCTRCGVGISSIPYWMRDKRLIRQKNPKSICRDCYVSYWLGKQYNRLNYGTR
mgnify:CR=1 FL=1